MRKKFLTFTIFFRKFAKLLLILKLSGFTFFLYKFLILLNKKNSELYFNYAYFLIKNKKYSEAIQIYKKALVFVDEKFKSKLNLEIGLTYLRYLKINNKNAEHHLLQSYLYKGFKKSVVEIIYPPKFLLTKFDVDHDLFDKIYTFEKLNPYDTGAVNLQRISSYDRHANTFQSHHNIHQLKEFKNFYLDIEKFINNFVFNYFADKELYLKIKNMWFVITRTRGSMHQHTHNADLSGVFYLKVSNVKKKGKLNIINPKRNLEFINFKNNLMIPEKKIYNNERFIFEPENYDLVIFNSYLEHFIDQGEDIKEDRISLPWDADLIKKN